MDDDLVVRAGFVIPQHELVWKFSRSSGPGGQGVNTTDSRAQLTFDVARAASVPEHVRERALKRLQAKLVDGCLTISAAEHRSQLQNRRAAERRLVATLQEATSPPPRKRKATKPTKASVDRRIKAKKSRGITKRLRQSSGRDD